MYVAMPVSIGRFLLATLFLSGSCAYTAAQVTVAPKDNKAAPNAAQDADLSSVFADKIAIPREVEGQQGTTVWKGNNFPLKDTPRFRRTQSKAGDFALYRVLRSHRNVLSLPAARESLGEYLMLEYVHPSWTRTRDAETTEWSEDSTATRVRVYGVGRNVRYSKSQWPTIWFRGLLTDAAGTEFPFHMPPREMVSFKDESISLADLTYFRDYTKFAAETHDKSGESRNDDVRWSKLEEHPTLGRIWRFNWDYADTTNPGGGTEILLVAEGVPVRGLVFARDEYSSSSGANNYVHTIQLLNFGRLSAAQVRAMETAEDVLPEELEFWKQMSEKHRPKAK
jgi:hypothetical protein